MDTSLLITLFVAMIAIIPGIFAIIKQLEEDKNNRMVLMTHDFQHEIEIHNLMLRNSGIRTNKRCEYCKTSNTNNGSNCMQCGAPLGD